MSKTFLLFREGFTHMSPVSGFTPLIQELGWLCPGSICLDVSYSTLYPADLNLNQKIRNRWKRQLQRSSSQRPQPSSPSPFCSELHELIGKLVSQKLEANPSHHAFLSFGENQYAGALAYGPQEIRSRLWICLHQPPSWHRLHWLDATTYEGLGGIICLSGELACFLRGQTSSPVMTIRHGVNLDVFHPVKSTAASGGLRLLVVGQWLRDFETLATALPMIKESHPDIELDCVVPRMARESTTMLRLARHSWVRWHSDLPAESLRRLYQQASLLFLPLIDATANNAVVEALACGLPVITTAVGGIPEYCQDSFAQLCPPGDATAHAQAVSDWLSDPLRLKRASLAARAFAEQELSWPMIARHLQQQLDKAMHGPDDD